MSDRKMWLLFFLAIAIMLFVVTCGVKKANQLCAEHGGYSSVDRGHTYCKDGTVVH